MSASTASAAPAAKPPVEMVNVQIDGTWMKFPKGLRMIKALEHGRETRSRTTATIRSSRRPGNCRMCLVETGMPSRPGAGPDRGGKGRAWIRENRVDPPPRHRLRQHGQRGNGDSLVVETRRGVPERGDGIPAHQSSARLSDLRPGRRMPAAGILGGFRPRRVRFRDLKVKKPKNEDIGPRIMLDDERCIMCSRCIRFCSEIVDDDVLGFTERGSHTVLTVHPGKRLDNNYSLNTVDICPVGALTSKDFRFQMRVWFLKETKSICTGCARGCNTLVGCARKRDPPPDAAAERRRQQHVDVRRRTARISIGSTASAGSSIR